MSDASGIDFSDVRQGALSEKNGAASATRNVSISSASARMPGPSVVQARTSSNGWNLTATHRVRCSLAAEKREADMSAFGYPIRFFQAHARCHQGLQCERRAVCWANRMIRVIALDRLSLDMTVQPGEIYGLVGESGSGKTTVSRLIVGLEKLLMRGRIRIFRTASIAQALSGRQTARRFTRAGAVDLSRIPYQSLNAHLSLFLIPCASRW